MNVKLLKRVRDYIAEHPDNYNQTKWCGSACCIAGTVVHLSGKATRRKVTCADPLGFWANTEISRMARQVLGITYAQADRLFNAHWDHLPARYQVRNDMDAQEQAARAYDRINRFIETKGAE